MLQAIFRKINRDTWDHLIKDGAYSQELNWLAVDNKGQLGIFTSLMNAPIPDKVKSSLENYEDLRKRIELISKTTTAIVVTKEKGNFSDWTAYADKGLFAFDFQDVHRATKKNQYDLIARPVKPLTIGELHLPSLLADSVTKLDCDFGDGDVTTDIVR
jgi:hypothetical protein